jgi:hypothetical protein
MMVVEAIAANCGEGARRLILTGHRFLPPKVVLQLSRTTPERQRYEFEMVEKGRRPFSTHTTVFDTTGYGEVASRLGRAGGFLNKAAHVLAALLRRDPLPSEDKVTLIKLAETTAKDIKELRRLMLRAYDQRPKDVVDDAKGFCFGPPKRWNRIPVEMIQARTVRNSLTLANAFVGKCVRDLPRAKGMWPSRKQLDSLLRKLDGMLESAFRIATLLKDPKAVHSTRASPRPRAVAAR